MDKSLLTAGAERRGLVRMQFTFDNTCGQYRKTWPAQKKLNEIGQAGDINWLELILHLITLGNIQEHEHFPPMFSSCWIVSPHLSRVFATFLLKGSFYIAELLHLNGTVATLLHIWGAAVTLAGIGLHSKRKVFDMTICRETQWIAAAIIITWSLGELFFGVPCTVHCTPRNIDLHPGTPRIKI